MEFYIELFKNNWFYVLPYILVIFIVHFLKENLVIYSGNKKGILILLTGLILSLAANLIPSFMIGFNFLIWLGLSLQTWIGSGFLTVVLDKFIQAGVLEKVIDFVKSKLNKS